MKLARRKASLYGFIGLRMIGDERAQRSFHAGFIVLTSI
jgi:hypothetical protein